MIYRRSVGIAACSMTDGTRRLRLRLSMPGQNRVQWWLPCVLTPADKWNSGTKRVAGKTESADKVNKVIESYLTAIDDVFGRYELIEKRVPAIEEVKRDVDEVLGLTGKTADSRLFVSEVFELYITDQGGRNNWSNATVGKFRTLAAHVAKFRPNLRLQEVNDGVMEALADYMLRVLNYKNTTCANQLTLMRCFLRWSAAHSYYTGHSHETYHPRIKGVTAASREIIYLTREEVHQLMNYEIPAKSQYLFRVRDVFLFCCFTGLRFSDVKKLRRCDVNGSQYISVVTQKTTDALRIELNSHSAAILRKYEDTTANPLSPALPVICNADMNRFLKELGKLAGLNSMTRVLTFHGSERIETYKPKYELMTTHVARRTFVVSALQLGIPPEVIMRWTGHSSYEAMKPYVAIVDELKQRNMSKFDNF